MEIFTPRESVNTINQSFFPLHVAGSYTFTSTALDKVHIFKRRLEILNNSILYYATYVYFKIKNNHSKENKERRRKKGRKGGKKGRRKGGNVKRSG